jgi:FtsZ-binding cell division protein ZapB
MKKPDLTKAISRARDTRAAEELLQKKESESQLIPLARIGDRPTGDTQPLNRTHLAQLVESIAVIGLITPLTVDRHYRLLAGGHRKAALVRLATEKPERFAELFAEGVPVRVMAIDAEVDTIDALQKEVEENTQRRNYTAAEIREAARKLEEAGYERIRGRPAQGQKSLNRELMSVFRLSREYISRILNESDPKSVNNVTLSEKAEIFLKQAEKFYQQLGKEDVANPEIVKVQQELEKIMNTVEALMDNGAFGGKSEKD